MLTSSPLTRSHDHDSTLILFFFFLLLLCSKVLLEYLAPVWLSSIVSVRLEFISLWTRKGSVGGSCLTSVIFSQAFQE